MITKFWFPYWVFHLNSFPVTSSDRIFPHCKWNADGLTTRHSTMNDKKLRHHRQVSFWAVKSHKFLFFLLVIPKRQHFHLIHSVLMDLKSRCNPPTTGALLTIPIERTQLGTAFGAKKLSIHHPQQGGSHPLYRFNEIGRTLGLAPCDWHEGRCHPFVGKGCRTTSLTVIQNARTSK